MNDLTTISEQVQQCTNNFKYFVDTYCPINTPVPNLLDQNILMSNTEINKQLLYRLIVYNLLFSTNLNIHIICDDLREQTTSRLEILKIIGQLPQYFKHFVTCNNSITLQIGTNKALWVNSICSKDSIAIIINITQPNFVYENCDTLRLFNCKHIVCIGQYNNSLNHNLFKQFKTMV